jgi:hypothetical protein
LLDLSKAYVGELISGSRGSMGSLFEIAAALIRKPLTAQTGTASRRILIVLLGLIQQQKIKP